MFTFGCSYTRFQWPTWADIISKEFDEFYNWGYRGLGNRAIAERIAEAFVKHNINKDDTVIVQWSHTIRHDYIRTDSELNCRSIWKTRGNIFNEHNKNIFDSSWVKNFWDEKAYFLHTLNQIILTQQLLKSIGCRWFMFDCDYLKDRCTLYKDFEVYYNKIFKDWNTSVHKIKESTPNLSWTWENNIEESHPSIDQHALMALEIKKIMCIGLTNLNKEQQELIDFVNKIKNDSTAYLEFEEKIRLTDWAKTNILQGYKFNG